MRKAELLAAVIAQLEADLLMTKEAVRIAHDAATNEESKPENEYDTRGLEASYLAGAQAKRAAEIDEALGAIRNIPAKDFGKDDGIASGAYVELLAAGKRTAVIVLPLGGGTNLTFEGKAIQVITPSSVLGEALVGLKAGDFAEIEIGARTREYEILSVA